VREVLTRLLDASELDEYKETYGRTLVCGTGWIDGWAVGVAEFKTGVLQT
jgi:acetyl-CoA carboxylase carboxyltransferase component